MTARPATLVSETATVPFARDLARYRDRTALVTPDGEISYRDLADRVDAVAARFGVERRLVLLAGGNTLDSVVAYLAALAAGHPIILAPPDGPVDSLIAAYDPDVVVRPGPPLDSLEERHASPVHEFHPDLALLLSTSGSTGSAKLVRLSHRNLQANAEAIAGYLGITPDDRAATTLPMHYCYGLSVINSHLLRGASLILTSLSVADRCFWELFRRHRGTSFAGVPYTFELLDRVGFGAMRLPHLRYVTQAGGRMAPDRVQRYAEQGRRAGWDLFVMYGQTEATARMAYLPPELAASHPHCIGVAIPGGSFRLQPVPGWSDPDTGELVYTGPNTMLGYAESRSDLRLGRTVDELYTGDIARRTGDGLYQIVGRRNRFIKAYGLRVDLPRVEATLADRGLAAWCVGTDEELVVALTGGADHGQVQRLVARDCGLPPRAVRVCVLPDLPRLPNGKPDYPAIQALVTASTAASPEPGGGRSDLRDLFAEVLCAPDVTDDDTFVGLGGDSLSYVEMSIRLEKVLGHLPRDWHTTPIRDLRTAAREPAPAGTPAPARWRRAVRVRTLDTSVALRALAIVLIVGTHATLVDAPGGAHLLLGVAGFNVARFHLTSAERGERIRGLARSIRRIALASMVWIGLAFLFTDAYRLAHVFLVNYLLGPKGHNDFWFIETLLYILTFLCMLLAVPAMDRIERRFPYGLPMALMAVGLITRYQLLPGPRLPTPLAAFWLVALGWAAAKATSTRQRLWLTAAIVVTIPGFHGDLRREALMVAGLVLLVWVPTIPSVAAVNRVAGVLAASSLYVYLIHWQVYPHLAERSPLLATVASVGAGICYAALATAVTRGTPWRRLRGALTRDVPTRDAPSRDAPSRDALNAA